MTIVATAGHVDHGKSTLVRAITGTDPDRLAEEKERGLTIDLGFAATALPSGRHVAFVDVPGHVRFLKNMLAGVGAVQACLFAVAATEGWKAQSEEHLRILELLGVDHGVVALTAVASVDDARRTRVAGDVRAAVAGTFLDRAELIEVDAPAGHGVDRLRAALDRLVGVVPPAPDRARPRLWVDRSFSARGAGTVVTGTLTGGSVSVDDELRLEPAGVPVRIRGIERHGASVGSAGPGSRTALNLSGVGHRDVRRGDALVRPDQWHRTEVVDAALTVLGALDHPVSRRGAFLAYIGSGEHAVTLRVLGADSLRPGETGPVRLRLPVAVPLLPGDRFVLRDAGRGVTVGGGEILDVAPVRRASEAVPDRSLARIVAERGWVETDELERLTGVAPTPTVGRWVVDPERLAADRARLVRRVAAAGARGVDLAALDERDRALVQHLDDVEVSTGRAVDPAAVDRLADHPWLRDLSAAPYEPPPPPPEIDRAELAELRRRGLVVVLGGVAFAPGAVERAAGVVRGLLAARPDGVTLAEIRDALGTSRRFALALLEHLDDTGRTRRRGEVRVAGPRL